MANEISTTLKTIVELCDFNYDQLYRMVLIFVIFMIDLAVTKFSHPRKLMPTESMMMGVAINIVAARPTLPSTAPL